MKFIARILVGVVLVVLLIIALIMGPYVLRVQHLEANPTHGYYADFYLYISPGARRVAQNGDQITILVQPNNSGTNSDYPKVHRKDAWWSGFD